MNCAVCLDENISETKMHYMECLHYVCDECFYKLLTNSCPLCRGEITLPRRIPSEESDDDDSDDNLFFENDFLIPLRIRKDRQENKRRKEQRKRQNLDNIILSQLTTNNSLNFNIPNKRKRFHKKLRYMD
jgi:zinc-RING finger domain